MAFWCWLRGHAEENLGLLQYGRGLVFKCKRCAQLRRQPLDGSALQEILDAQVEEQKDRAPAPPPPPPPETHQERRRRFVLQFKSDKKLYCASCDHVIQSLLVKRCPNCGVPESRADADADMRMCD